MNPPKPHFLLFCEGNQTPQEASVAPSRRGQHHGQSVAIKNSRWRFVLENVTSGEKFEATDHEAGCTPDRASLVAVLRGLEALEQPSKVTLVTNNRYVFRGLRYGLAEWRENEFAWEHFGSVQPIRNADVWRRIDRTLSYHEVQCRWMAPADAQSDCLPTGIERQENDPHRSGQDRSGQDRTDQHNDQLERTMVSALEQIESAVAEVQEPIGSIADPPIAAPVPSEQLFSPRGTVTIPPLPTPSSENKPISESLPESEDVTTETPRGHSLLGYSPRSVLFYPFAICWTICKRSLLAVWEAILRLDEGVESYLRCMLLLDPKHYRRRK